MEGSLEGLTTKQIVDRMKSKFGCESQEEPAQCEKAVYSYHCSQCGYTKFELTKSEVREEKNRHRKSRRVPDPNRLGRVISQRDPCKLEFTKEGHLCRKDLLQEES